MSLLKVEGLKKHFAVKGGLLKAKRLSRAVDGVDFSINQGEVFAVVGESGCGKSTLARLVLRLIEPTDGHVYFNEVDITRASRSELLRIRRQLQIIFQDPFASLNPRHRIIDAIGEPLIVHKIVSGKALKEKVVELLNKVGMDSDALYRYPHEFSGGQRQRICIARALAVNPMLIVADEPTSALDVSIQAQIINLLDELRTSSNISFLFISHNLEVVRHFSDTVAVMYLGKVVELGKTEELFPVPFHPYTAALISAVPRPDPERKTMRIILEGDVPSHVEIPPGCPFHPRCPKRFEPCSSVVPELREVRGRVVACHLWG